MKKAVTILACAVALLWIFILFFILHHAATEYLPPDQTVLFRNTGKGDPLPDTITVLTWNTGYAGLGERMDFFYDGGRETRTGEEETRENLAAIVSILSRCEADIVFLQEVDIRSRRSYGIDQFEAYRQALPAYHGYFAANHKVDFVPIPLREPMGRVHSGITAFTRYQPEKVIRHRFPQPTSPCDPYST